MSVIDQSEIYLKASRYWDVFTLLHYRKHPVQQFYCMRAEPQENKRTHRRRYIQFIISQAGVSLVVVYHQFLEPLKWIFPSLEILPTSVRDVKYYMDFWSQSQFIRKIENRALHSEFSEWCLFLRQCRMWKRFLQKMTNNWQQDAVLFSYTDTVFPCGYGGVFTQISKIFDSWNLHAIFSPCVVQELSLWSLNVNSDV